MRVIPVMDLQAGLVVRGVAGRRSEYRPVSSRLANRPTPSAIGRALRELGYDTLYVADLDALGGHAAQRAVYAELADQGWKLWIDAGLSTAAGAAGWLTELTAPESVAGVIVGLETLYSPHELAEMVLTIGANRLVFSVDLREGTPWTQAGAWAGWTAAQITNSAFNLGVTRFIVLDVAQVGLAQGLTTLELCGKIRQLGGHLEITTGGGIRDREDIAVAAAAGVDAVLVASALHDGALQ